VVAHALRARQDRVVIGHHDGPDALDVADASAGGPKAETAAEPAKSALAGCITDTANFKAEDKRAYFIVALENACEQRVTCEVFANIRTARGSKRAHGTLVLAAKSAGAAAKKSYRLRVKAARKGES